MVLFLIIAPDRPFRGDWASVPIPIGFVYDHHLKE
jgi:hypothetical protein